MPLKLEMLYRSPQSLIMYQSPQSTFSFCLDDGSEDVTVVTTPPEAEVSALWTVALLRPIIFLTTETGGKCIKIGLPEAQLLVPVRFFCHSFRECQKNVDLMFFWHSRNKTKCSLDHYKTKNENS